MGFFFSGHMDNMATVYGCFIVIVVCFFYELQNEGQRDMDFPKLPTSFLPSGKYYETSLQLLKEAEKELPREEELLRDEPHPFGCLSFQFYCSSSRPNRSMDLKNKDTQ